MSRGSLKIMPGAIVCSESIFQGDITVGPKTVIHPKVKIIAQDGPIIIGENNIIEEQTEIINVNSPNGSNEMLAMIIGNNNVFEVGSTVKALKVGDSNVLEAKSFIGRQMELSNGCTIAAKCSLDGCERLPENTVVYGREDKKRRFAAERPPAQTLQLDFLTKIIPNYHFLKKANVSMN